MRKKRTATRQSVVNFRAKVSMSCYSSDTLRKLGPRTLQRFRNRILNIHPALLPKHGGQGKFGIHVHESVLAAGDAETGVSIHLVDDEYDHGSVIAQCRLPVFADDTPATLQARTLMREQEFLVETLRSIVSGSIRLP